MLVHPSAGISRASTLFRSIVARIRNWFRQPRRLWRIGQTSTERTKNLSLALNPLARCRIASFDQRAATAVAVSAGPNIVCRRTRAGLEERGSAAWDVRRLRFPSLTVKPLNIRFLGFCGVIYPAAYRKRPTRTTEKSEPSARCIREDLPLCAVPVENEWLKKATLRRGFESLHLDRRSRTAIATNSLAFVARSS